MQFGNCQCGARLGQGDVDGWCSACTFGNFDMMPQHANNGMQNYQSQPPHYGQSPYYHQQQQQYNGSQYREREPMRPYQRGGGYRGGNRGGYRGGYRGGRNRGGRDCGRDGRDGGQARRRSRSPKPPVVSLSSKPRHLESPLRDPDYRCKKCVSLGRPSLLQKNHQYKYCVYLTARDRYQLERENQPHRLAKRDAHEADLQRRIDADAEQAEKAEEIERRSVDFELEGLDNGVIGEEDGEMEQGGANTSGTGVGNIEQEDVEGVFPVAGEMVVETTEVDAAESGVIVAGAEEEEKQQEEEQKDQAVHEPTASFRYVQWRLQEFRETHPSETELQIAQRVKEEIKGGRGHHLLQLDTGYLLDVNVSNVIGIYIAKLMQG